MFNRAALFRAVFVPFVVIAVAPAFGCSSEDEDPGMKVEKTCVKNACDVKQATSASYCSRCLSACSGASFDCDPSESCAISCGGDAPTCTDSDRDTCSEQGFKATLPTTTSHAVAVGCKKMFDRIESCGVATVATSLDCDTWAKTERPEVASNYECVAALPCGEDESSCDRPTTDFGQRLCDGMDAACGERLCDDELRAILDKAGGWLKESVQSAGLGCTTQSTCGDAKACVAAWVTAAHL